MVSEPGRAQDGSDAAGAPWDIDKLMELSRWAATQRRVREGGVLTRGDAGQLDSRQEIRPQE